MKKWAIFMPFLTTACSAWRASTKNHRHRLDGLLWDAAGAERHGATCRQLIRHKWNSVWKQSRRWGAGESGVWDLLLQALADSGGARTCCR